ncbi:hypothetical protein HPB49_025188 [Dermacentor silvarum]|uniref:Uncharacterized protein n=1 Tax=Dermacentor silvarum TaxID=543639 RepID=A0ACB8CIR3_DERSI|nr:hypothetical protein HPB49_025188 [Dermacentor silvarum]
MAPPSKTGGRPRTATAIVADAQVGYDPHSMMWTTVPSSDSGPELPQPFQSTALAAAVARREQASNAVSAASTNAASPDAAADAEARTCSPTFAPPAPRSAGPQQGKKRPLWQPQPLPKPKATDFVIVLKPRTQLSLATVFPENGAGRALIAHLGATATRLVTVVIVREQNLILTYTSNPQRADKLIGEFAVPYPVGPVPLFGYLRADTQDSCYGVVTVRSSDTEATLCESLYWPEGEILHVRRFGTSNKVRLTFPASHAVTQPRYVSYDALLIPVQPYKKTVPACGRCGSVGHRPDSCPFPKPDLCGICGKAVPLTDGARVPHECTPRSATGRRHPNHPLLHQRAKPAPRSENVDAHGNRGRGALRLRRRGLSPLPPTLPGPPPHPDAGAIGPSLRGQTPDGPPTRKSTTRQVSPASPKPHPPSPEPKPTAKGDLSWATRVRQGPQVSGSGGAASPPPPSMIPNPKPSTPSTPTREQVAIRGGGAHEPLALSLTRHQSGQAPEAMDSAPSEYRDTTPLLAPIEARVSSLAAHVASIVTTIEDRLPAAFQTVVDHIPGMIGYATWSQHLVTSLHQTDQTVQLSEATPAVDNHLHLRWRRQKHNRQLKIRIAALTQEADEYAAQLADSNWVESCNTAAKQMSNRNTWRLFRALIDPSQMRTETQKHLQRASHAYAGDLDKLARALRDRYLCSQQDPLGLAYSYAGS